ncbi:MAG: UDP-N-acetylmuramoyl-L-alanyl-D-glutamate--2,6-diaminopimelate ligase [Clostridia bacterium]|nr:UDP-N-acetylmuramoyl-L-alanyl-D-glutamate--2,6-diaminopimelate ligase [Clostridia bacterium]
MTLSELLKNVEIIDIQGNIGAKVSGIAFNSAEVKPGDVFVCISGFKTDGHKYAADALEKGAIAVIAERALEDTAATVVVVKNTRLALSKIAATYYDYPYKKFRLIGVTGTNGKTTTTYLIKAVLENCGQKVGLIGTNQNMIGETIIPSKHTTPDSLELMSLFNRMAEEGVDTVVMEVSSHSLALDRVASCEFDIGAFTNVTQDHLDFHETMENYIQAKAQLFKMCRVGVLNHDDDAFEAMNSAADCETLDYSTKTSAQIQAENIEYRSDGVKFDLAYMGQKTSIELSIPGGFSVYNALTAAGCCLAAGLTPDQIAKGLKAASGVKGRIEVVKTNTDYTVIIDYAHTPDGLLNILNAIRGFAKGRIITLFGCGGDRDKTKRPQMGKIAAQLSDFCIVTSDNPRSEDPSAIIEDVLAGVKETKCKYAVIENRFEAIEYALDNAKKDDIILLAGKGHEPYQILKDRTIVFDEREIVLKLIDSSEG